jgi:hypothetical protein
MLDGEFPAAKIVPRRGWTFNAKNWATFLFFSGDAAGYIGGGWSEGCGNSVPT